MRRTALTPSSTPSRFSTVALSLPGAMLIAASAAAAEPALDNSGNYRQEVRACREGRTAQDLPTCLREAHSADADRRRGQLTTVGSLVDNALARCQAFQAAEDKEACRARIVGQVEITGSVAGGGILRQVAITPPAPQATPGSPGSAGSRAMGAGAPSQAAPSDDIAPDNAPPASEEEAPEPDEGETLEDQWPAPALEPMP